MAQMFDSGYGGEHWLASFAIYLLTDVSRDALPGAPAPVGSPNGG